MPDSGMVPMMFPDDPGFRTCTVCGEPFEREQLLVKDGDLCPECRKTYGGMAFVCCNTCNKIISRLEPGLAPCGLLVKPYDLLHVAKCPICDITVTSIVPEEMKAYETGGRPAQVP